MPSCAPTNQRGRRTCRSIALPAPRYFAFHSSAEPIIPRCHPLQMYISALLPLTLMSSFLPFAPHPQTTTSSLSFDRLPIFSFPFAALDTLLSPDCPLSVQRPAHPVYATPSLGQGLPHHLHHSLTPRTQDVSHRYFQQPPRPARQPRQLGPHHCWPRLRCRRSCRRR